MSIDTIPTTVIDDGPAMFANMNNRIRRIAIDIDNNQVGSHLFDFPADPEAHDACAVCLGGISIDDSAIVEMNESRTEGYYVTSLCRHCHDAVTAKVASYKINAAMVSLSDARASAADAEDIIASMLDGDGTREVVAKCRFINTMTRMLNQRFDELAQLLSDEAHQGVS